MTVDRDTWTCPDCQETVRGGGHQHRRVQQRIHGRRHTRERGELRESQPPPKPLPPPEPEPPRAPRRRQGPLVIPPAPKAPRRSR